MNNSKWEPVTQFKHGDPVWAWDSCKGEQVEGVYIGRSTFGGDFQNIVELGSADIDRFRHVEHRKKQITIKELAKRADIDLNKYEIVE